jgi:hypothetical protein
MCQSGSSSTRADFQGIPRVCLRIKEVSFARIESEGRLRLSTWAKAHHGEGIYAWGRAQKGVGKYVDIEVPAGTAVETLSVNGQTWYRLVPAAGDTLPVKVVGTNLTSEQIEFGRKVFKP